MSYSLRVNEQWLVSPDDHALNGRAVRLLEVFLKKCGARRARVNLAALYAACAGREWSHSEELYLIWNL